MTRYTVITSSSPECAACKLKKCTTELTTANKKTRTSGTQWHHVPVLSGRSLFLSVQKVLSAQQAGAPYCSVHRPLLAHFRYAHPLTIHSSPTKSHMCHTQASRWTSTLTGSLLPAHHPPPTVRTANVLARLLPPPSPSVKTNARFLGCVAYCVLQLRLWLCALYVRQSSAAVWSCVPARQAAGGLARKRYGLGVWVMNRGRLARRHASQDGLQE